MEIELLIPKQTQAFIQSDIESEKMFCKKVLTKTGSLRSYMRTHDVIDISKQKIVTSLPRVIKSYFSPSVKPFVFIVCNN
jgi:hypothetical protein